MLDAFFSPSVRLTTITYVSLRSNIPDGSQPFSHSTYLPINPHYTLVCRSYTVPAYGSIALALCMLSNRMCPIMASYDSISYTTSLTSLF